MKNKNNAAIFRSKSRAIALEPRLLFDGAGAVGVADAMEDSYTQPEQNQHEAGHNDTDTNGIFNGDELHIPGGASPSTLVIIDSRVDEFQSLLADLPANTVVRVVDSEESGLAAISDELAKGGNFDAVHIFSHGTPGSFTLGSDQVDSSTLANQAEQLSSWSLSLTEEADILLYGCDIAQGETGQAFISELAHLTGADIAASTNATGAAAQGGDWVLESETGSIEAQGFEFGAYGELMADPAPDAKIEVEDNQPLIGEDFTVQLTFDNTGSAVGYGPFADLFIGHKGTDGSTTDFTKSDGLNFKSATFFGSDVEHKLYTLTNNAPVGDQLKIVDGKITHPITGQQITVPTNFGAGDQLLVVTLPFGSFTPEQLTTIDVTLTVDKKADPNQALHLASSGGFMFGKDPLDNPDTDPALHQSATNTLTITPQAFTVETFLRAPEGETATGPNFVRHVDVVITPAAGTNLSDATKFHFTLPDGLVLVDGWTPPAGWEIVTKPVYDTSTANDTLVLKRVAGQAITAETTIRVGVYVTEKYQNGTNVIAAETGDATAIVFAANAVKVTDGQWQGVSGSNLNGTTRDQLAVNVEKTVATLTARSVQVINDVIYKNGSTTAMGENDTVKPGDALEYRLQVDISDFFRTGDVVVTDTLPDGITFDKDFVPTLNVQWRDVNGTDRTSTVNFDPANVEVLSADGTTWVALSAFGSDLVTQAADGKTLFRFNLSKQLAAGGNEHLLGGLVGTDGNTVGEQNKWLGAGGTLGTGATTALISFKAKVDENYRTSDPLASGITNQNLKERDVLNNTATVTVGILDRASGDVKKADQFDDSSEAISLPAGKVNLEIATITRDGVQLTGDLSQVTLAAGDKVTYKLTYDLPIGDYEKLSFDAYLPMPVFNLTAGGMTQDTAHGNTPDAGQWNFGTGTTTEDHAATVTVGDNNKITFELGNSNPVTSSPKKIELVFTATVTDKPMADRLKLTAQGTHTDSSSQAIAGSTAAINQIVIGQPDVHVYKGYVNPADTQTGTTAVAGLPVNNKITSATVAGIGASDASKFDGGDKLTVIIAVENQGTSAKGAFNVEVKDALDPNLTADASTLKFYKGDGTLLTSVEIKDGANWVSTTVIGNEAAILAALQTGNGVRFVDGADGALGRGKLDAGTVVNDGSNIIYISYAATVKAEVLAKATSTTKAQLTGFANSETGDNFLAAAREEAAKIDFRGNKVDVKIIATDGHLDTGVAADGKTADAVVGEFVDYQVTISLAEAKTENGQIVVTLPAGLGLVNVAGVTEAGNVSISHAGFGAGSTINGNSVSTDGTTTASITEIAANKFTVSLGDIINNDNDEGDETITLNFRAVVLNTAENITAKTLAVKAEFTGRDTNEATRTATTTVREPQLTATITADKTTVTADDEVTYTLTVKNNSIYAAHDVVIDEVFNQIAQDHLRELTIVSTSANSGVTGGVVGATEAIKYEIVKLDKGESFTVTFKVKVEPGTPFGQDLTIDPTITWTSIPGDAADRGAIANTTTDSERTGAATESTANAEIGTGVNKYSTRPSATIKFATPTPQITIDSTSYAGTAGPNDPDVTTDDATETTVVIGETVRIRMVVELPESTSTGVKLTPTLPAGLTYLGNATVGFLSDAEITSTKVSGAHIVGSDPQAANPSALITIVDGAFDLGDLNNPDRDGDSEYIIIEFDAVVANIASNTKDTELKVNYKLSSAGASDATSGDVTLTIVEPAISIDKQITEVVYANADLATSTAATVTYSITIKNTGNSVAHDVELNDVLPAGATILTAPSTSSANGTITDNSTGGAPNYVIGALGVGEEITITYSVTVDDRTQSPTGTDTNATVTWTSLPSSLDSAAGVVERTGAGDGANTYTAKDPAAFATVTGTLWDDTNNKNGVIDGDELKLAGVEVTLTATSGPMNGKTLTTITDGNGLYNFGALPVGDYTISAAGEVIKEIQGDTDTLIPTWDTDGDGNGLGTITITGLTEGQVVADKNVGYLQENDAPTVTFDDTTVREFTEGVNTSENTSVLGTPINLGTVTIVDLELERGLDSYNGTTLIVGRNNAGDDGFSANLDDVLGFDSTKVTVDGANIQIGGTAVATFTNVGGLLTITFNNAADTTTVNTVASAITYANSSQHPDLEHDSSYNINLRYRFDDANDNDKQGYGGSLTGDATIGVKIIVQNDPPVANNDTNGLKNSVNTPITGNVIEGKHTNGEGTESTNGTDTDPDTKIEDLKVSNIQGHGGSEAVGAGATIIAGKYGTLTIKGDGSYSYVLDQNNADVYGLAESTKLTEEFTYTLSDGDKTDTATLVITITGDTPPALGITVTDHNGDTDGQATVHESGLSTGSEPSSNKHIHTDGKIKVTSPSGLQKLEIGGTTFTAADLQTASPSNPLTVTTPLGTLTITGATFTGDPIAPKSVELTYTYELNERADNSDPANETGLTDKITLVVTDKLNATEDGTLDIYIVDDQPTAVEDTATVDNQTNKASGNALDNDTLGADRDVTVTNIVGPTAATGVKDAVTGVITVAGEHGELVIQPTGEFTYIRTNGEPLETTEEFTYTITDADGDTSTAKITITINDKAPIVTGPNGDPVPPTPVDPTDPTGPKQIVVTPNGCVNESGLPEGSTPNDGSNKTTGTITYTSGDGPHTATVKDKNGTEQPVTVGKEIETPSGKVTITAVKEGEITYEYVLNAPTNGDNTTDEFDVTITDKDGDGTTVTVVVDIVNDKPAAVADTKEVFESRTLDVDAANGVLTNDNSGADGWQVGGDGKTTAVVGVAKGANTNNSGETVVEGDYGTLTLNPDGSYTYVAKEAAAGVAPRVEDVFTYTVRDADGDETTATLTITVINNRPPVAENIDVEIDEDSKATGNLLDSVVDPDQDDELTITEITIDGTTTTVPANGTPVSVDIPGSGTFEVKKDGSYTFTPVPDWNGGVPTITYKVDDNKGADNSTDTATLTIKVNAVPDVEDDAYSTHANTPVVNDVLTNDSFNNSDAKITNVTTPSNGTVTINPDNTVTYTPNPGFTGTDTYEYTVTSGGVTETATVTITVTNTPPEVNNEVVTTPEDTPVTGNVLISDKDGDTVTVTELKVGGQTVAVPADGSTVTVEIPGAGSLEFDKDGEYTFTPVPDWNGTVPEITYTVDDGSGTNNSSSESTLKITVTPVVDIADDAYSTHANTPVVNDILTNDSFNNPDAKVTNVTTPSNGTVTINPDNTFTYTPNPGFTGTDTYEYTVTSGGVTETATVTITVTNTPPVAEDDSVTIDEDTPVSGNLLTNDKDPDGDPITVTEITVGGTTTKVPTDGSNITINVPGKGKITVNKTGGYTFTPNPGVIGQIPDITYKITDGNGGNDSAKLTINVRPGNPPVAPPPANPVDGGFNSPLVSPADPIRSRGLMDSAVITDPSVFYEGERWDDVRRLPIPLQPVVYVNNEVAVAQQQREADDLRANSAVEQTQPFVSQSISLAMGLGQDHNLFVSHAVRDAQQTAASLDSRVSGRLSRTDLSADSMLFTPDLRSPQFMQDADEATKAKQRQAPVVEEKEEGEDELALQLFETDEAGFMTEQGVMPVAASFTEQLRGNSRHLPFAAREKNFLI